jgi:hypothetical protein
VLAFRLFDVLLIGVWGDHRNRLLLAGWVIAFWGRPATGAWAVLYRSDVTEEEISENCAG